MKKTVAVFFGGQSTEHDISIISALAAVITPLKATGRYTILPVYITKEGKWVSSPSLTNIKVYQSEKIKKIVEKAKPVAWQFGGRAVLKIGRRAHDIDVVFPVMHGTFGEDGSLMGMLRMANVPFVGCDMDASVVAMDKVLSKQVAAANGIPTSKFKFFTKQEINENQEEVLESLRELKMPLFVKPAHLGSSIGITRVTNQDDILEALKIAVSFDEKVIVEEGVHNLIEVTVPVIGNAEPKCGLVERPLVNPEDFFDFETKYISAGGKKTGGKKSSGSQGYSELPAAIGDELYKQAEETALSVYKAIGASGIARVDLLIDSETKIVYFNEVNPLPGSLYNHNWRAAGVSASNLVEQLIGYAEEKFANQKATQHTFSSSFLSQF